jgi:hypothetical protein
MKVGRRDFQKCVCSWWVGVMSGLESKLVTKPVEVSPQQLYVQRLHNELLGAEGDGWSFRFPRTVPPNRNPKVITVFRGVFDLSLSRASWIQSMPKIKLLSVAFHLQMLFFFPACFTDANFYAFYPLIACCMAWPHELWVSSSSCSFFFPICMPLPVS